MRTARLLGISRGALRYRMRYYGIERPSGKNLAQHCGSLSQGPLSPPAPLRLRGWRGGASLADAHDAARHPSASQAQLGLGSGWEQVGGGAGDQLDLCGRRGPGDLT